MSPISWVGLPGHPTRLKHQLAVCCKWWPSRKYWNAGWDLGAPDVVYNKLGHAIPILAVVVFPCTTSMVSATTTTTTIKTYLTWLHTLIMYLDSVYAKLYISNIPIHYCKFLAIVPCITSHLATTTTTTTLVIVAVTLPLWVSIECAWPLGYPKLFQPSMGWVRWPSLVHSFNYSHYYGY